MKKFLLVSTIVIAALAATWCSAKPLVFAELEAKYNKVQRHGPYPISAKAKALHRQLVVADMHSDSLLWSANRNLLERSNTGHVDIPRLIEGNVALQAFTIVTKSPEGQNIHGNSAESDRITKLVMASGWPAKTWNSLSKRALWQAQQLHNLAEQDQRLSIIKTKADLSGFLASYKPGDAKVAGWIGIEGAHALEAKAENLQRLFDSGVRMIGPTHFFDNAMGGSAHGQSGDGLTAFGKQIIRDMERLGIAVDLAHVSPKMIDDILDMATKPVLVSHTGVRGNCDTQRNISDQHVKRIAANGGVIGIGFWVPALCDLSVEAIVGAIKYVRDFVGIDYVGLGSDFDGTVRTPMDVSGMGLITEELLRQGFTEDEIRKVMGGNLLRVLRSTLP